MGKYQLIREAIHKVLKEAQWNFHYGKNHNGEPYYSENKFMCHHETGQFGSGTYFSTYNGAFERRDALEKYGDNHPNQSPEFIQIKDGIYRVDFKLYNNLYRVYSESHGDILHTMMSRLNGFYGMIAGDTHEQGEYKPQRSNYKTRLHYQIIARNADALGLKCPSYLKLIRMAQNHYGKEKTQSFATLFMEMNGFNGVNVSGIDKFDNSRHGSVIYDLSKTQNAIVPMEQIPRTSSVGYSHTNSIATKSSLDFEDKAFAESLLGKFNGYHYESMTKQKKLSYLKNILETSTPFEGYNFPSAKDVKYYISKDEDIFNYIFRYAFNHQERYANHIYDHDMMEIIAEHNLEYYINFTAKNNARYQWNSTFLLQFLSTNRWNFDTKEEKEKYLNHLLSKLNRPLTAEEEEYIEEDYYHTYF